MGTKYLYDPRLKLQYWILFKDRTDVPNCSSEKESAALPYVFFFRWHFFTLNCHVTRNIHISSLFPTTQIHKIPENTQGFLSVGYREGSEISLFSYSRALTKRKTRKGGPPAS